MCMCVYMYVYMYVCMCYMCVCMYLSTVVVGCYVNVCVSSTDCTMSYTLRSDSPLCSSIWTKTSRSTLTPVVTRASQYTP